MIARVGRVGDSSGGVGLCAVRGVGCTFKTFRARREVVPALRAC